MHTCARVYTLTHGSHRYPSVFPTLAPSVQPSMTPTATPTSLPTQPPTTGNVSDLSNLFKLYISQWTLSLSAPALYEMLREFCQLCFFLANLGILTFCAGPTTLKPTVVPSTPAPSYVPTSVPTFSEAQLNESVALTLSLTDVQVAPQEHLCLRIYHDTSR